MKDPAIQRRADGFRERGGQVTRIEAFVDAAFAFAVTLLVISFEHIPETSAELLEALKRIPAFAASFALIATVWNAHNTWSRRYGLDDRRSVVLSLTLVFQVLVYVYPLRILFESCFAWLTGGWIPPSYQIRDLSDLQVMYRVYAAAWSFLGLNVLALYAHAWSQRGNLALDRQERLGTVGELGAWALAPATGCLSALLIGLLGQEGLPEWVFGAPGMCYALMGFTLPCARLAQRLARARIVREIGL